MKWYFAVIIVPVNIFWFGLLTKAQQNGNEAYSVFLTYFVSKTYSRLRFKRLSKVLKRYAWLKGCNLIDHPYFFN